MKMLKKCIVLLLFSSMVITASACSKKTSEGNPEEPMEETEITTSETTSVIPETTTFSETTTSETTTETSDTVDTTSETTTETTAVTTSTTEETTTETTTTTTVAEVTAPETSPTETETVSGKFEAGIWWSTGGDGEERYFCFYNGSDAGSIRDQESGMGLSFEYETTETENRIIFHMGDNTDNTPVTVNFTDENTAILTWDNGTTETLKYQGLGNFDTFYFYSNLDLCEMALNYYETQNGYRPEDSSAQIQANGKILIKLYDNLENHDVTSAEYTVDRFTAKGSDNAGNSVNLA